MLAVCYRAESQSAVGQTLAVHGSVNSSRAKHSVWSYYQLRPGDTLSVGKNGSLTVVFYENGSRYTLGPGVVARVERAGLAPVSGKAPTVLPACRIGLRKPGIIKEGDELIRDKERIGGELERTSAVVQWGPRDPSPSGVVRDNDVLLKWKGPIDGPETTMLLVRVLDAERKAVFEKTVSAAVREYALPVHLLDPGKWYTWTVEAATEVGTSTHCTAALRILKADERAAVERAEQEVAAYKSGPDAEIAAQLLAQTYADAGMFREAASAYRAILAAHPEDQGLTEALSRITSAPALR